MKNLEIGNYARVGTAGIKKITAITRNAQKEIVNFVDERGFFINIKYVQQVEKNVLNLLQDGDYINGYRITKIGEAGQGQWAYWREYDRGWTFIKEENIMDILTKEQFESRKFKVKGG